MAATEQRVSLVQGEFKVSNDPGVVFVTLLGSCIAACLHDPTVRIGGMNHFLLPPAEPGSGRGAIERYGVHLMELLMNEMMRRGARKERMVAKLFGGARMTSSLLDIGAKNIEFAKRFASTEGIKVVGESLGGFRGRRIQFWPESNRVRQSLIAGDVELKRNDVEPELPQPQSGGDLILF